MTARRPRFDIRQAGRTLGIVFAIWAAIDVAFYLGLTRREIRAYQSLVVGSEPQRKALAERRAEVEANETFLKALERAQSDLARLRDEVLATRRERMIRVQLELKDLCDRFGIDLASITFENEILPDEELDKLVMNVPLEGGYAALRRFLQAVESSDKFLVVERVALGEGKQGGVTLELKITLATYFDLPDEMRRRTELERRAAAAARRG